MCPKPHVSSRSCSSCRVLHRSKWMCAACHKSMPRCWSVLARAEAIHVAGQTPVIFTSRTERAFPTRRRDLPSVSRCPAFSWTWCAACRRHSASGQQGRHHLERCVEQRSRAPHVAVARQILPGVSVVRCPPDRALRRHAGGGLPGNVGDDHALATVCQRLTGSSAAANAVRT